VPEEPPPIPRYATKQGIAGLTLGALGVAGLGVGIGFGALAMSKQHASNSNPNDCIAGDRCFAAGQALRIDAIHAATASTAAFIAGGASAAVGIIVFATAPTTSPKKTTGTISLRMGLGNVELHGRF
jgi:hypothetical protein